VKYWRVTVEYVDTDDTMLTDDGLTEPRIVSARQAISDEMMTAVVREIGPEGLIAGATVACYQRVRDAR
jgi:hypothetical protein